MGFESHIDRELQRAGTGLVHGEDYWFSHGLKTDRYETALRLKVAIDDSGDFGPCRVVKVEVEPNISEYKLEFGAHKQNFREEDDYPAYVQNFFETGDY